MDVQGMGPLGAAACMGAVLMAGRAAGDVLHGMVACCAGGLLACAYVAVGVALLGGDGGSGGNSGGGSMLRLYLKLWAACAGLGALGGALSGTPQSTATL